MLGLLTSLICWMCYLHKQCDSYICSVIYAYMELVLYIELGIDICYSSVFMYIDNLPKYTLILIHYDNVL